VPIEVTMAKLSPTMESGQLVKWVVKVGDQVKEGDTLAEIQTDKAVMPMEAFDDGVVAHLDVQEGAEIALGQRVLVLATKGEDPTEVAARLGSAVSASPSGSTSAPPREAAAIAPDGNGHGADGASASSVATAEPARAPGDRVRSTPLARRLAEEAGLDLALIPGTGPGGRIIKEDVEAFVRGGGRPAVLAAPAPAPPKPADLPAARVQTPPAAPAAPASLTAKRIEHTRMRKTIAQRMQQAKHEAPEIHVTVDIRMDQVMAMRERLNDLLEKEQIKLSVGDFVTKAVSMALVKHPALNASYEPDAIVQHADVNIGIAVALDGGLIVPVLHNADRLGLKEIRVGTQGLAEAARANKLVPRQMMGATFTISNLGMYGVREFDAILNLPEVGILAVGATEQRPVVERGQLSVGWVMTVTLTADHRAVDGATAADFLRTLRRYLEEPAAMLL
jgi:pyruvate dehydrogenase E2 component (dihydrolipoamide acetyltransferase)